MKFTAAELDAMPVGTVLQTARGWSWQSYPPNRFGKVIWRQYGHNTNAWQPELSYSGRLAKLSFKHRTDPGEQQNETT